MLRHTEARVLVCDPPGKEGCANAWIVEHASLKEVVVDSCLLLKFCIAVVGSLHIQFSDVYLKTEGTKLLYDCVHLLPSCIFIGRPVMGLDANAIDLDIFLLHALDHSDDLI